MLKLNRTTEYSLMALSYIRGKNEDQLTSAREIADHFGLPFEILAKTLQRLKDQGIITSTYGTRGGYVLARDLSTLNLADFLGMMEGPLAVVTCANTAASSPNTTNCEYNSHCMISSMMKNLNARVHAFLHQISIEELTRVPLEKKSVDPLWSQPESTAAVLQGEEP